LQCGANETLDVLLDGRIKIIQPRDGYRVNEDSLRLCRFVRPMPGATGIDLGAGCGILAIVMALEGLVKSMVALEIQESLVGLARRNAVLNRLAGSKATGLSATAGAGDTSEAGGAGPEGPKARIEIIKGDIRRADKLFEPGCFDLAVSNPPYHAAGRGRTGPLKAKTIARHEQTCSLEDLVRMAAYLLKPMGIFTFCHLRERRAEIDTMLQGYGFQVIRRENKGALVLIEALGP
jgi:tRNA1Val (adenine37-N6)-methyltransferase